MQENCAQKVELNFPIALDVKVIMDKTLSSSQAKGEILALFSQMNLPAKWKTPRESGAGRYISYTVSTFLKTHPEMRSLYEELGKLSGVKLVL